MNFVELMLKNNVNYAIENPTHSMQPADITVKLSFNKLKHTETTTKIILMILDDQIFYTYEGSDLQ